MKIYRLYVNNQNYNVCYDLYFTSKNLAEQTLIDLLKDDECFDVQITEIPVLDIVYSGVKIQY